MFSTKLSEASKARNQPKPGGLHRPPPPLHDRHVKVLVQLGLKFQKQNDNQVMEFHCQTKTMYFLSCVQKEEKKGE